MKVEYVKIENLKRFKQLEVYFKNTETDQISDRFLVLGDNGAGKTTLLQAIALPLALATQQIRRVEEFDWVGFLAGRFSRWGRPHIELGVMFSEQEIQKTRELALRWHDAQSPDFWLNRPFIKPGDSARVKLTLSGDSCRAETMEEYFQFHGRHYARQLVKTDPSVRDEFSSLPGIFWFDQFRNLGSAQVSFDMNGEDAGGRLVYESGVAQLRRYLSGWALQRLYHGNPPRQDYLMQLEELYARVFPGRTFAGVEPMPGVDSPTAEEYYFLFNDGRRTYDIVEMSAGEQNVFPILYSFVRMHIANSVVLIDEVDLNLHPPAAQLLMRQLPSIGPTCQFITTTHSEAISNIVSEGEIKRLPGGALCL